MGGASCLGGTSCFGEGAGFGGAAGLELALEQTASFGEAILSVLKGVLERLQIVDQALGKNASLADSIPGVLQAVSERLGMLEDAVRKSAASEKLNEAAFQELMAEAEEQTASEPEGEVAELAAFLCSEHARYLTGTAIPIDGGAYAGLL